MKAIISALVKAQQDFAPALKQSENPHFRSRYVDLAGCVEAVIDSLNGNGIALVQRTSECDNGVIVETIFMHTSGEVLECGKLHVPASKQDAQGYGSALTYARRYSLMAACGIAPEDDDGNAASKSYKPAQQQPEPVKQSKPYSAEAFARNLPTWRGLIADGKNTPEQIIKKVQTKGTLTAGQIAAIKAPIETDGELTEQDMKDIQERERAESQGDTA